MASIGPKRPDGTYRARYRDSSGREHAKHFVRKTDARRWLNEVTASVVTGRYVDPKAGLVTFRDYAEDWRKRQVHRPGTVDTVERALRLRVYKRIGAMRMSTILPSHIQALVSVMSADGLAPATIAVTYRYVSTIFRAAVADKRIHESPCVGVKLPRVSRPKVVPLAD